LQAGKDVDPEKQHSIYAHGHTNNAAFNKVKQKQTPSTLGVTSAVSYVQAKSPVQRLGRNQTNPEADFVGTDMQVKSPVQRHCSAPAVPHNLC
jgi:hypothetical protein